MRYLLPLAEVVGYRPGKSDAIRFFRSAVRVGSSLSFSVSMSCRRISWALDRGIIAHVRNKDPVTETAVEINRTYNTKLSVATLKVYLR